MLGPVLACAGLLLGMCSAAPAQAALVSAGACNEASLSQPFLRWGEPSLELVPGGDFEGSLYGWSLSGGAGASRAASPRATGAVGSYSLHLPGGASARSRSPA